MGEVLRTSCSAIGVGAVSRARADERDPHAQCAQPDEGNLTFQDVFKINLTTTTPYEVQRHELEEEKKLCSQSSIVLLGKL